MLALKLLFIGMGNFKLSTPNDNRFVEQNLVAGKRQDQQLNESGKTNNPNKSFEDLRGEENLLIQLYPFIFNNS
jgi:hypothetical protein